MRAEDGDTRRLLASLTKAVLDQGEKLDALVGMMLEQQGNGAVPSIGAMLSAGEVALRLGKSREWVYDHKRELGALKLADGPKAPLGFMWAEVERRMKERSEAATPTDRDEPKRQKPRRRSSVNGVPLLEVRKRKAG